MTLSDLVSRFALFPLFVHDRSRGTWARHRNQLLRCIGLLVAVLLAGSCAVGCGANISSPSTSTGNSGTAAGIQSGGDTGNGEAASGEAPAVPFESPTLHYRVEAPGAMTVGADGTASAHSGAERLSILVVTGAAAADPMALAKIHMDRDREMTGFRLKSGPVVTQVKASTAAVKAFYAATDGTNAVTGKANSVVVVKYWVPKDASTLAVLTYTVTESQYDAQGADDVANTFRWL